jgi:putative hydrolase of the HAD superfamily
MPIRAVFFDVGGVLFHQRRYQQAWEQRLGLESGTLGPTIWATEVSRRADIGQATEDEVWTTVAQLFDLDQVTATRLRAEYFAGGYWETGLLDFARSLRSRVKTGIISNGWPKARAALVDYVNDSAFDDIVFSAEVGLAKPDRRIFDLALDRLGVKPGEAVFVDDVLANVEAAKSIGMIGLRFEQTMQVIDQINFYLQQ